MYEMFIDEHVIAPLQTLVDVCRGCRYLLLAFALVTSASLVSCDSFARVVDFSESI